MGTLLGSLYTGIKGLYAAQMGLAVTGNNIANVNTPGYSRQRAVLADSFSVQIPAGSIGTGVDVQKILAVRDRYVEYRLIEQAPEKSRDETLASGLSNIDAMFNETQHPGIQSALTALFSAYSSLASQPESLAQRNDVLTKGQQLTALFRSRYSNLTEVQLSSDRAVSSTVDQINALSSQIAKLNQKVVEAESGSSGIATANDLRDNRDELVRQLSNLVNISTTETESGAVTIGVAGGRLLVAGSNSNQLTVSSQPPYGYKDVFYGTTDITSDVTGGELAGHLQVRDTYVPAYKNDLDTLAAQITTDVNALHVNGYGMNNLIGYNFFTPWAGPGVTGAATAFSVDPAIAADVNRIATSTAINQPGNNDLATDIADLATALNLSGGTASYSNYYANLTFKVGSNASTAGDNETTEAAILTQLQNQRDSISGVSLDEEAAAMIQFQRGYQASAQFMKVIDDLTAYIISTFGQ